MSDTDYSTKERVETMYTVEVVLQIEHAGKYKEWIGKPLGNSKERVGK